MTAPIPIIDLFAGPGGLGEGFSACRRDGEPVFKIALSIEKDYWAHQTLELRAFVRQFPDQPPPEYYDYLAGTIDRVRLFNAYAEQARHAKEEAWCAQLGAYKDSKGVDPGEVDRRISAVVSETPNWLLIGGPPCQAYSIVGRSRMLGQDRKAQTDDYSNDHRHKLYREYLRILARHAPPVFIMENVKGILSSKVNGTRTFLKILKDLQKPGKAFDGDVPVDVNLEYRIYSIATGNLSPEDIRDYVIKSEEYGIPQKRHRVILLGVRGDLRGMPRKLEPRAPQTVSDVIGRLPRLRSGLSKTQDSDTAWKSAVESAGTAGWVNSVADGVSWEIVKAVCDLKAPKAGKGGRWVATRRRIDPAFEKEWFVDRLMRGCCNHETRSHIEADLHRYLFAACFAKACRVSPKITDFPKALYPKHKNVRDVKAEDIIFDDRFRVQVRNEQATTVVSHIAKDGHYFIHYDPSQCRSLTVREAARLQTFPDNYFFEGPRTEQYSQVGNAVPPLLARQIASVVADLMAG